MKKILTLILTALALFTAIPALAHPHAWIDVAVELLVDETGKVSGLRQSWYFDEGYSAFTLEGLRMQFGDVVPPEALQGLAAENLKNLADYSWFTHLDQAGQGQAFQAPTVFSQQMRGTQLVMQFDLMLEQAVPAKDLTWQIYDPGYYIEMLYRQEPTAIAVPQKLACSARIEEPHPTEEMVIQAAMLDKDEKAEDGLGALFAQKAILSCP